jgi:hypothetical protein
MKKMKYFFEMIDWTYLSLALSFIALIVALFAYAFAK